MPLPSSKTARWHTCSTHIYRQWSTLLISFLLREASPAMTPSIKTCPHLSHVPRKSDIDLRSIFLAKYSPHTLKAGPISLRALFCALSAVMGSIKGRIIVNAGRRNLRSWVKAQTVLRGSCRRNVREGRWRRAEVSSKMRRKSEQDRLGGWTS